MKRYLLFAGRLYYPEGGAQDLISSFSRVEEIEIESELKKIDSEYNWAHVYDMKTEQIVLKI